MKDRLTYSYTLPTYLFVQYRTHYKLTSPVLGEDHETHQSNSKQTHNARITNHKETRSVAPLRSARGTYRAP